VVGGLFPILAVSARWISAEPRCTCWSQRA